MPPANRHEPRRAKSSTSDYSVTEFLREFPDDAACLEHPWRTRKVSVLGMVERGGRVKLLDIKSRRGEYAWRYNQCRDGRAKFFVLLDNVAS
jgi:hypothetical protein